MSNSFSKIGRNAVLAEVHQLKQALGQAHAILATHVAWFGEAPQGPIQAALDACQAAGQISMQEIYGVVQKAVHEFRKAEEAAAVKVADLLENAPAPLFSLAEATTMQAEEVDHEDMP